jgi:hypothetical protein
MATDVIYRRIVGQKDKLVLALAAQNHRASQGQAVALFSRSDFNPVGSLGNDALRGGKADALKVLHIVTCKEKARGIAPRGPEACSTQRLNQRRTPCI